MNPGLPTWCFDRPDLPRTRRSEQTAECPSLLLKASTRTACSTGVQAGDSLSGSMSGEMLRAFHFRIGFHLCEIILLDVPDCVTAK